MFLVGTASPDLQRGFCRFELIYSFGRMIGLLVLPILVPLFLMSIIYACTIVLYRRKVNIACGVDEIVKSLHCCSYLSCFVKFLNPLTGYQTSRVQCSSMCVCVCGVEPAEGGGGGGEVAGFNIVIAILTD